ncbi:histidine phosphatase family protein [Candidatus Woesearchaeota archaeon]|nr:histidine phosphatase family protein [Candidatus Woesearchaeota archaeon]
MKLFLVRHGETIENKQGIMQGWLPGKLSSEGKKQAKQLADRLKNVPLDIIYTSDLKRCVDTAQAIAEFHPNIRITKTSALRERSVGEFEGRKKAEVDWSGLAGDLYTNRPPGGETFQEMWQRVQKFYQELIKKHKTSTVLVVSHGGPLMFLQTRILCQNFEHAFEQEELKNTGISEFEID